MKSVKEVHNVVKNLKIALQIISNITDKVPKKKRTDINALQVGENGKEKGREERIWGMKETYFPPACLVSKERKGRESNFPLLFVNGWRGKK